MTYNADLGAVVLKLRFTDKFSPHRIAKQLGKSRQYVTDVIARWETQGILQARGNGGTKHSDRKMTDVILQTLRRLVAVDDSCTASEYAAMLTMEHPGEFTHLDVARALKELNMTYKLRTTHNNKADERKQLKFQQRMRWNYDVFDLMFTDEASCDGKGAIRTCAPSHSSTLLATLPERQCRAHSMHCAHCRSSC